MPNRVIRALYATFLFLVAPHAQATIIQGPEFYGGHTYYLLENATWTASESEAVSLGGHLLTTNEAAENRWAVRTFITTPGREIALWLGITDRADEGTFVWTSGDPVGFVNWEPGEPNNFLANDPVNGEDYGMLRANELWNDTDDAANDQVLLHGVVELPYVVPEPSTALLVFLGAIPLAIARRQRRTALPARG